MDERSHPILLSENISAYTRFLRAKGPSETTLQQEAAMDITLKQLQGIFTLRTALQKLPDAPIHRISRT